MEKRTDLNYVSLGSVLACKDEGRGLKLEEKEKWYLDEVERLNGMIEAIVGTRTRLITVEYKQWKKLRYRDYLSIRTEHADLQTGLFSSAQPSSAGLQITCLKCVQLVCSWSVLSFQFDFM